MAVSPGGRPADASPLGKKGGPRGLTDYTREIAHALMRRGIPKSKAIAIARSQQVKWSAKSKNPAIRAAAAASTAEQHVLDHRKRGRRDLSWDHAQLDNARDVVLSWDAWNSDHKGPGRQPAQPDLLTASTHANITSFQKAHGLPPTGMIDASTVAWLNNPKNSAAAQKAASGGSAKAAKKKTDSAAKKALAAKKKVAKAALAAKQKSDKSAETAFKNDRARKATAAKAAVQKNAKGALANPKAVQQRRTASLSVPVVGSGDGVRVTTKDGKKALQVKRRKAKKALALYRLAK